MGMGSRDVSCRTLTHAWESKDDVFGFAAVARRLPWHGSSRGWRMSLSKPFSSPSRKRTRGGSVRDSTECISLRDVPGRLAAELEGVLLPGLRMPALLQVPSPAPRAEQGGEGMT
eukprot:RCo021935